MLARRFLKPENQEATHGMQLKIYCHGLNSSPAWRKLAILPERIILIRFILLLRNIARYGNMPRACCPL